MSSTIFPLSVRRQLTSSSRGRKRRCIWKADRTGARLALAGAGRVLAQVAQISAAHALGRELPLDFLGATIIDKILRCISVLPLSLSMLPRN
jgi:hypothetical protein